MVGLVGTRRAALLGAPGPYAGYALALDFKNGVYRSPAGLVRSADGLPGYSYTRSGAKSELAASGAPVAFAANAPGIVPGVGYWSRGTLTNLLLRSQALATAPWGTGGVSGTTVTNNAAIAPDGTLTATSITPTVQFGNVAQAVTLSPSTTYTFSAWVYVVSGNATLYLTDQNGVTASGTVFAPFSVTPGVWTRVSRTFTTAAGIVGTTTLYIQDRAASGFGTFYAWQAQIVAGPQPGPIIATTTATSAVGVDSLTLSDAVANEDQLFMAVGTVGVTTPSPSADFADWSDGTPNNRISLFQAGGNNLGLFVNNAGSGVTLLVPTTLVVAGDRVAIAGFQRGGSFNVAARRNNGAVVFGTLTAKAMPGGLAQMKVGGRFTATTETINGPMELVCRRRGTFSDADITVLLAAA